jgi:inner membrane protein
MSGSILRNSIGLRLVIIAMIMIGMVIPSVMIQSLIKERKMRRDQADQEVSEKWGADQTISGPVLSIPFRCDMAEDNEKNKTIIKYAHLLPDELRIAATIRPEIRSRGIYRIVVYNARLIVSAVFAKTGLADLKIPGERFMWDDAVLTVGLTDMKGIQELVKFKWNDMYLTANPGIENKDVHGTGISANSKIDPGKEIYNFSTEIDLNGSHGLFFTPMGKETDVSVTSEWSNPSFTGMFLPEIRNITASGFDASWKILHMNRNYPQKWVASRFNVEDSAFGLMLILPVDEYQKTMRTAKYAIMFIALTFLGFFMIELLNKRAIHPVQYILVGIGLLVFYTLLLSFTEHIAFAYAYLLASVGIISLLSAYSWSVLSNVRQTATITAILVALYGYLYIILQLQNYALLMGSLGSFVILAFVMYLTRKIDWFTILSIRSENAVR